MEHNGRARQPVPNIRSTPSYIIFLDTPLGQGATSKVYGGRHKKSGKRVACKVPNMPTLFRMGTDMERESQVLLGLRHENIVCLEAIEKDQISKENILMMELCTGGSLYDVLEKPEHSCGLAEKDFVQVLADMTAGMEYLRNHGVVHRDVKPGNIMCFKNDQGHTIYKLADFGAARQLSDDENFTSLHGTEEYLHPRVFERAVLRKPAASPFDARIDLWSIGATLYHLATGQLPFRPQGGRKNSSMMFKLTTKKAPGVISGVQTGLGENEITWSRELPESCRLSTGLKKLITPLLAGLLECNPNTVWSFTQFFEASQSITRKTVLDILWVSEASYLKVYCNPADTFVELQEHIASQTKLSASKQSIMFNGETFKPGGTLTVNQYPDTSEINPILLCTKEPMHVPHHISPPYVANMPVLRPRFSTQNDYPIAKGALSTGHILQLRQKLIHRMHRQFDQFVTTVRSELKTDMLRLQVHQEALQAKLSIKSREIEEAKRILNLLRGPQASGISEVTHRFRRNLEEYGHQLNQYQFESERISAALDILHREINFNSDLHTAWQPSQGCNVYDEICTEELVYVTNEMEDIYKRFSRDKKTGKLSYNEEQIHKMEKLNLGEQMKRTMQCSGKCEERWREQHNKLMVWHNNAFSQRQKLLDAEHILGPLIKQCNDLDVPISDLYSKCWQIVESKLPPSDIGHPLVHQSAREILLSASTQTSLPRDEMPLYQQHTAGLLDQHYDQLTNAGKPLVMGKPFSAPASQYRSSLTNPQPYQTASALSAPSYGLNQHQDDAYGPRRLVARGISKSAPTADPPSELYGAADLRYGDYQHGRGGSRMIEVSKDLKKKMVEFKKQSGDTRLQMDLAQLTQLELDDTSLEEPVMPPYSEHSSLLDTLTGGLEEEGDENLLEGLDIKRPPVSYQSSTE